MKIQDLIDKSRALHRQEHIEKEKAKKGVLRAGSTGIINEEGEVAGACHRVSLLRSYGVEIDPPTWDKYIMFELGYANEDVVLKQLKEALKDQPDLIILQEEEIPISWSTKNGTLVTGRPDIVVCTANKEYESADPRHATPILGLELKSVHSVWVARDVLFKQHPKLANLAQAAHYMWKLGLPEYKLFYKSYSQLGQGMAGSDWIAKMFPRPGEPGSEYVEYTEVSEAQQAKGKEATVKHIKQFEIIYDLKFDKNGRLQYRMENMQGVWTNTVITKKSIEDYFEFVSKMVASKDLGPVPVSIDSLGDKLNYTACQYCALKDTCKQYASKGYDKWLSEVVAITEENKKTKETVKKRR